MKTHKSIIFILTVFCLHQSEAKILYFLKNNRKLTIPSTTEFSSMEQKLQNVLNTYHNGQGLTIRVQFIDPEEQGVVEGWLEWVGLIDNRNDIDPALCNDIEILFEWNNQSWGYKGITFDNVPIIEQYFLTEVKEYIVDNFSNGGISDERTTIHKWLKVITNVLDMEQKEKLLTHGAEMVKVKGYLQGHRLAHWMKPDYQYDLEPFSTDSTTATTMTYISNKSEVDAGYYEFMPNIISMFEAFKYHHPTKSISEIPVTTLWTKVNSRGNYRKKTPSHKLTDDVVKKDTTFHKRDNNDTTGLYRLKLKEIPINDNEKYNFMSDLGRFGWQHTSCNFFAFDLQKKVFGRYLLPLECAFSSTTTSKYLPADANFIEISKNESIKLAEAGFLVIAIKPGHITTLYPDGSRNGHYGRVVQSGKNVTKSIYLNEVWVSGFGDVKTYAYLGYIFN